MVFPIDSSKAYPVYIVPLAVFAVFTYLGPILQIPHDMVYPAKTIAVAACLVYFYSSYKEDIKINFSGVAMISGILVFIIWVVLEGYYGQNGYSEFNPFQKLQGAGPYTFIFFRLTGAVLVVPIMEELFWRSFALRMLINTDFTSVRLGQFTWFSFLVVSLSFGLAHYRWLPGIIAGMVYALVLYHRKNLFDCILSHATTNLLLGIYVLITRQWTFW